MSEFMTVAGARSMVAGLEAAMSLAPRVDTAAQLAAVYSTLSRDREALKLIEFVWGRWQNIENGMNYAMMLQDVCEWGRAARVAETAHWLDPENQYGKLLYAESLLRQGLWKQAWPLYNEGRPTTLGERMKMGLPGIYRQWDGRKLGADEFLFVLMEGGSGNRINSRAGCRFWIRARRTGRCSATRSWRRFFCDGSTSQSRKGTTCRFTSSMATWCARTR